MMLVDGLRLVLTRLPNPSRQGIKVQKVRFSCSDCRSTAPRHDLVKAVLEGPTKFIIIRTMPRVMKSMPSLNQSLRRSQLPGRFL